MIVLHVIPFATKVLIRAGMDITFLVTELFDQKRLNKSLNIL